MKLFYWKRRKVLKSQNFRYVMALHKCLTVLQDDDYHTKLTCDQYSINILDEHLKPSSRKAVRRSFIDVVRHLIKTRGNINVQDMQGNTLLHKAVKYENFEAVYMLLYYGADVNIMNNSKNTVFMDAVSKNNIDVILILINFCDESAHKLIYEYYVSLLTKRSANARTLIKQAGSDKILAESFMLLSRKINPDILLDNNKSFLETFFQICTYSASDWLKCMYLIFDFPNIELLMDHWNSISSLWMYKPFFLKEIERFDRVSLIWTWLSLGGFRKPVFHMWKIIWLYGFAEEMEALLYCSDVPERSNSTYYGCSVLIYPVINFNLVLDEDLKCFKEFEKFHNYKVIVLMLEFILNKGDVADVARCIIIKSLQFFSLPYHSNEMLGSLRRTLLSLDCPEISQQVEALPTIPSLLEQGRNKVREIILTNCVIKKSYQFYDIVKQLHVPLQIKDIILFKRPIYNVI